MKAHLQRLEREHAALGNDQLAVEHDIVRTARFQRPDHLGAQAVKCEKCLRIASAERLSRQKMVAQNGQTFAARASSFE